MAKKKNYKNMKYGDGSALIEILNIGFEPLLTLDEYKIYKEIGKLKYKNYGFENSIKFLNNKIIREIDEAEDYDIILDNTYINWLREMIYILEDKIKTNNYYMKLKEDKFKKKLIKHVNSIRTLYDNREFKSESQFRNIALFESDLTRSFGCKDLDHCDDIISVVTYYTEIFQGIVNNGFVYKNKKFVFFTAGAGQTRNKKSTFVSEEKLNENYNHLFCGLTKERINELGGMNTNKFLAYTSLCQTNSSIWEDFDIDRCIVVEDIEYSIPNQKVRHIYTETPDDKIIVDKLKEELLEVKKQLSIIKKQKKEREKGTRRTKDEINFEKQLIQQKKNLESQITFQYDKYHTTEEKEMDVIVPFTDGFGITLIDNPTAMLRMPFVKGLVAYISRDKFKKYCEKNDKTIGKVTDIYGKEYDIDEVDYILTKSQFKMYKYYTNVLDENDNIKKTGWEVYKDNFKKYKCDACRCNIEEENLKLNAKTNYQILQTLTTEMTDQDIRMLAKYDIDTLNGVGTNIKCMLNLLGANPDKNDKLSSFQKSLLLYPEMLKDFYVKSLMTNTKNSMVKKFRSGKFNINGAYTFAIPDTLACLQWWFLGERNLDKLGLIEENSIYCSLFDSKEELDCLRSPHLDHAHCIRKNHIDDEKREWYPSSGVYIGVKDIMSKLLMYDNDGDKLLVHNNKTIIKNAKNYQKKYSMIPNYYDMPKANPETITNKSLFEGIVMAYHHGNIGTPSNEITKIFMNLGLNSSEEEIKRAIEIVALRCCDVNYVIDYAKTLYKPYIPKNILNKYKIYSGKKLPHFFIYAKNKRKDQVEELGECNIDRIENVVKSQRISYKTMSGKYTFKMLMKDKKTDIKTDDAQRVIDLYRKLETVNRRKLSKKDTSIMESDEKKQFYALMSLNTKKQKRLFIEAIDKSEDYIVDVLVKSLKNDVNKDTLWRLFGDTIYEHLAENLKDTIVCQKCYERFKPNSPSQKYCENCEPSSTYKKMDVKQIQCIDCEEWFDIDAKNTKACRCEKCQDRYNKELNKIASRERMRRYRERKNKNN